MPKTFSQWVTNILALIVVAGAYVYLLALIILPEK